MDKQADYGARQLAFLSLLLIHWEGSTTESHERWIRTAELEFERSIRSIGTCSSYFDAPF